MKKNTKKIFIGSDHRGVVLKKYISKNLEDKYEIIDLGAFQEDSPTDYPDIAHAVSQKIKEHHQNSFGILICSTGQGMAITANKHHHIRCALCFQPAIAKMARLHNNANVCSLGTSFFHPHEWHQFIEIVNVFLETDFEAGRHQKRIDKI